VGALVGWWFDRNADRNSKNPEATKQLGVLLASGMIVGEGLIGIIIAGLVAFAAQLGFSNQNFPLNLVSDDFANAPWIGAFSANVWIGGAAFVIVMAALYGWLAKLGRTTVGG